MNKLSFLFMIVLFMSVRLMFTRNEKGHLVLNVNSLLIALLYGAFLIAVVNE